jgi:hypothetical protein
MRTRTFVILTILPIFIAIVLLFIKRESIKNRIPEILAVLSIYTAFMLLIHQHLFTNDVWFNWQEFWHHESVIACFVSVAVGLILGKYLGRR